MNPNKRESQPGKVIGFQGSREDNSFIEAYAKSIGANKSEAARQVFARGRASLAVIDQAAADGKKVIDLATQTWKTAAWINGKLEAKVGDGEPANKALEERLAALEKELAETRTALSKSQAATISGVVAGLEPMILDRLNKIIGAAVGKAIVEAMGS